MRLKLVTTTVIPNGCFGMLLDQDGVPICLTLERTFEAGYPIIPNGVFKCVKRRFNKGGYDTFEVTGIANHSLLLFHKANLEIELNGCIALAITIGELKDTPAVLSSAQGFDRFWQIVRDLDEFELEVVGR